MQCSVDGANEYNAEVYGSIMMITAAEHNPDGTGTYIYFKHRGYFDIQQRLTGRWLGLTRTSIAHITISALFDNDENRV